MIAIAAFLIYGGVAIVAGWWLLDHEEIGKETETVEEVAPSATVTPTPAASLTRTPTQTPGATPTPSRSTATPTQVVATATSAPSLISKTTTNKQSSAIVIVIGLLTAGGWLLIPLKFAWDELSKDTEAAREEIKAQAETRRETSKQMRDGIYKLINDHYGPIIVRMRIVDRWARHYANANGDLEDVSIRLLYAVALLEERNQQLTDTGTLLWMRNEDKEDAYIVAREDLRDHIYKMCKSEDYDFVLIRGVRAAPPARGVVPFSEFRSRVKSTATSDWADLQEVATAFSAACGDQATVATLGARASDARGAFLKGLTDVYREWYDQKPTRSFWRTITAPVRWFFRPALPLFGTLATMWRLARDDQRKQSS